MPKFADGLESELSCPHCGPATLLIVRTNRRNDSQFLSCPNWPECNYTRSIPEEWKMRQSGQPGLFDAQNNPEIIRK